MDYDKEAQRTISLPVGLSEPQKYILLHHAAELARSAADDARQAERAWVECICSAAQAYLDHPNDTSRDQLERVLEAVAQRRSG